MTSQIIDITLIDPNPYQTREREDPEHVERIAGSIDAVGLLQYPLARVVDGRYQLAYGHTRLAAFKWLRETEMPLHVVDEVDDLMMFELAVRENSERKDLTPIEAARAMQVYRDTFEKSSEEIGDLFGLAPSTVRNKMRLLELPEAVQERVGEGELTEGTARSLLTVQKMAPEKVDEMAEKLAGGGFESSDAVTSEIKRNLRDRPNTLEMWGSYKDGNPQAGTGLWSLDWAPDVMLKLTLAQFKKVFPQYEGSLGLFENFNGLVQLIHATVLDGTELSPTYMADFYDLAIEHVDAVLQLTRPPACTQCPYYVRLDGSHWCGLKQCHARKKKAWLQAETERLSQELEIPVYDRNADGRDYDAAEYWGNSSEWEDWFAERADHLRLKPKLQEYKVHNLTRNHCVMLVSVRTKFQEEQEQRRQEREEEKIDREAQAKQWEINRKNRELSDAFVWEVASHIFTVAFCDVPDAVIPDLADALTNNIGRYDLPEERLERKKFMLRLIAQGVLMDGIFWEDKELGPAHVAGHLEGVALTWGVPLPADWHALAEGFELESVSTETENDDD